MDSTIVLELGVLVFMVLVCVFTFLSNTFLKKNLQKMNFFGISKFFNKLFIVITDRVINKLSENNSDLKEANKELQKVIIENFERHNQDDKPKENDKDIT